jgi:hypothetical protein
MTQEVLLSKRKWYKFRNATTGGTGTYDDQNNKRSAAHAAINPQQATIGYRYGRYIEDYVYFLVTPAVVLEGDLVHGLFHLLLFFSMNEYTVPQPPFGPKPKCSLTNSTVAVVFPAETMV